MTIADKGYHDMVAMIRKARRVWRDAGNRDKAIDAIHLMRPEVGIEDAEKLFEWMAVWQGVPATELALMWCQAHWCPLVSCILRRTSTRRNTPQPRPRTQAASLRRSPTTLRQPTGSQPLPRRIRTPHGKA